MKYAWYGGVFLAVVPLQATVLDSLSLGGVRPDLCLVVTVLVAFTLGPWEGLLMGLGLGFIQDLFSAGPLGLNLATKAACGLLAGVASRYVASVTLTTAAVAVLSFSLLSGTVFLLAGRAGDSFPDVWYGIWSVMMPQAVLDAVVAVGVFGAVDWWGRFIQRRGRVSFPV